MQKIITFLKGKKTYFVMAATFIVGGLHACGVEIPEWAYALLAASGVGVLRAGISKSQSPEGDAPP